MLHNSSLQRRRSLRDSYADKVRATPRKERKPQFKKGPKTIQWDKDREKLKVEFRRAGITRCELEYDGCQRDNFLGFCHAKKRRNVITTDDREEVVLGCQSCHDILESKGHVLMYNIVHLIIDSRSLQVKSIFD